MKQKQIDHNYHFDAALRELFIWMMILLIILTLIRIIGDSISANQDMYKSCLNVCDTNHAAFFETPTNIPIYDRVECIRVCNSFHYSLKNVNS